MKPNAQWEFHGDYWAPEEIAKIEATLQELMEPDGTNLWRLRKSMSGNNVLYGAKRLTWDYDSLRGDTVDELIDELHRYYKRGQQ